ncbi:MAG: DegT/DnrJ/EryC1/StrS family aminotransferase [Thermodesulfovibrionales bacterium]
MIPRHSLPFDLQRFLSILVSSPRGAHYADVEKAYADALGVRTALLLPSVRAGIHMAILAVNKPDTIVVGPAYTCSTVHMAMALSGAAVRLIDSAPEAFLMPADGIHAATEPGCAVVLSEVYGLSYDQELLRNACSKGPGLRVLDMAMGIPDPERTRKLEARDVALFSFGWGKPMYAGWGGIACFQDPELAKKVRRIRDGWADTETCSLRVRHGFSLLMRTAMNHRVLFGLSHEPHLYRVLGKAASPGHEQGCQLKISGGLPPPWTSPMTALNRQLALYNLRHSAQDAGLRRSQAEIYSRLLVESGAVRGPGNKALPQSHFPILLPSAVRDKMCDYLRGQGIDTGKLFPFAAGLSSDLYPQAAKAADKVLTLPLGPTITLDEIRMVSQRVKDGLQVFGC